MDDLGYVGVLKLKIRIYESTSLKDKRRILKSIKDKVRYKYNFSSAEIGDQDKLKVCVLGFSCMASSYGQGQKMLDFLEKLLESHFEYEIIERQKYIL